MITSALLFVVPMATAGGAALQQYHRYADARDAQENATKMVEDTNHLLSAYLREMEDKRLLPFAALDDGEFFFGMQSDLGRNLVATPEEEKVLARILKHIRKEYKYSEEFDRLDDMCIIQHMFNEQEERIVVLVDSWLDKGVNPPDHVINHFCKTVMSK